MSWQLSCRSTVWAVSGWGWTERLQWVFEKHCWTPNGRAPGLAERRLYSRDVDVGEEPCHGRAQSTCVSCDKPVRGKGDQRDDDRGTQVLDAGC